MIDVAELPYLDRAVSAGCRKVLLVAVPSDDFEIMGLELFKRWREGELGLEINFRNQFLRLSVLFDEFVFTSGQNFTRGQRTYQILLQVSSQTIDIYLQVEFISSLGFGHSTRPINHEHTVPHTNKQKLMFGFDCCLLRRVPDEVHRMVGERHIA